MMNTGLLSIIIPAYNEEKMIAAAAREIYNILDIERIPNEIIFVDDGSGDATWEEINKVSQKIRSVRGIHFSRNFGKEAAIMCGLSHASGECCVVMDCDLQHPPKKITEMYSLWKQGYEIVEGLKSSRGKESKIHALAASIFYKLESSAVGFDMSNTSDFKLLDRKAVNSILEMKEQKPFFRALSSWIGYEKTNIQFDVQERSVGKSKWSLMSLIKYAIST